MEPAVELTFVVILFITIGLFTMPFAWWSFVCLFVTVVTIPLSKKTTRVGHSPDVFTILIPFTLPVPAVLLTPSPDIATLVYFSVFVSIGS